MLKMFLKAFIYGLVVSLTIVSAYVTPLIVVLTVSHFAFTSVLYWAHREIKYYCLYSKLLGSADTCINSDVALMQLKKVDFLMIAGYPVVMRVRFGWR